MVDRPKTLSGIIAILALVAATNCKRQETKAVDNPDKKRAFSESIFTDITSTADGGAYGSLFESGLWYLRGTEAVKVDFPDLSAVEAEALFTDLEITPLADGGAYAHSSTSKSVWYLREGTAQKVRDVPALTSRPISGGLSSFPLYLTERKKRLQIEKEWQEQQRAAEETEDDRY